mgnify:FL=1
MVGGTLAAFIGTLFLMPFVNREFFPPSVRPELILDVNLPSGASIASTKKVMEDISQSLYGDKRVTSFSSYIGDSAPRFILLFDPVPPEDDHGQMIIVASNKTDRDSLRSDLEKMIQEKYPQVQSHIRLITTGPPAEYPVMFRLQGPILTQRPKLARQALGCK